MTLLTAPADATLLYEGVMAGGGGITKGSANRHKEDLIGTVVDSDVGAGIGGPGCATDPL